jgi:hypothetical protein
MALKTETNTPEIDVRIAAAFAASAHATAKFETVFEHGQWWVMATNDDLDDDAIDPIYSVNDAEGGDAIDGFDFEQVN